MANPLRFGQTVSIKSTEFDNIFLTSDGHIKTKAQLFEIEHKKVASGTLFFSSLFQIYPKFMTGRIEQAQKLGEELNKYKHKSESARTQKIQDIEDKVFQEYKLNIELSEKNKNQPISVAQAVQFLHISSNKFLACNYFEAEMEKENFKLELNEFPSDNTSFRLMPAYQHQARSDGLVYVEEPIYIIMDKIYLGMKPYLQVAADTKHYENSSILNKRTMFNFPNARTLQRKILQSQIKFKSTKNDPTDIQESPIHDMFLQLDYKKKMDLENAYSVIRENEYIMKKEINVSLEKKSPFQISLFTDPQEDENQIYFGDVLWLHHIELNAILITGKNKHDEIIVSLQQTKNDQLGEFIGNTNGMWYIESTHFKSGFMGGPVEWGQLFRLRHFSLGKYLAIQKKEDDINSCFYLEDRPGDNSLLEFLPLPSSMNENQKYVTKDAFFKLKSANEWIQFIDKNLDSDHSIVMLRLSDTCKDDDVLKCYKANISEIQETSFLVSCFPVMKKTLLMFTHLARTNDKNKLIRQVEQFKFQKKIDQMLKVLQDLTRFSTHQFIISSQNRQKVLKEQYFIDILLKILSNISDENELTNYMESIQKKKHHQLPHIDPLKVIGQIKKIGNFGGLAMHLQQQNTNKQYNNFMQSKVEVIKKIYKLLICICKDNNENEGYVYRNISTFQYQAKFFEETTDFIISLLKNNEQLKQNLSDKIRSAKNDLRRSHTRSVNQSFLSSQKQPTYIEVHQQDEQKELVIFYKMMAIENRNAKDCLEFFRTISQFNNKGLSVNQELVYRFMNESKQFKKAIFWNLTIQNELCVEINQEFIPISQLDEKQKDYLIRLLRLYSELALSRNLQWRDYLIPILPMEFLFNAIFDQIYPPDVRSAFCNIALSVYIDQQPFHLQIVPNLCRVINYNPKKEPPKQDLQQFHKLSQQVLRQIHLYNLQLREQMNSQTQRRQQYQYEITQNTQADGQLQFDIISLVKTLIQFDVVGLVNRKEIYIEILNPLINILEYDKNNFLYAYIMNIMREESLRKAKTSNKILKTVKTMVTGAIDIGRNLVNVVTRKKEALEEEFAEQTLFSKHPITSSLFTITSFIQGFHHEQDEGIYQIQIKTKLEICKLLIFFQELRLDFLITNFLQFYIQKQKKIKQNKLKQELEIELLSILPPTLRTGIEEKNQKVASNLFSAMAQVVNSMSKFLQKKFTNYTTEEEMPDLDVLFSGANKDIVKSAILPSLLVTFHITNDSQLLDKIVQVMRRCFSQKMELFEKMRELEILIDQSEINCYMKMQDLLILLRQETEASELWMDPFMNQKNADSSKLIALTAIVTNINSLLFKHTIVTSDMEIISQNNQIISTSRQKVFTFLSGYVPLINFIRDSQNQLSKVFKENQAQHKQKAVLELLKSIYQCLNHFCKNNRANQIILSEFIKQFLDEVQVDFGQILLVCAIYEDNRFLCENISEDLLISMLKYTNEHGRQVRFLEFFKIIQVCQKQSLVENQLLVLQLILPHQSQKEEDLSAYAFWIYAESGRLQNGVVFTFNKSSYNGKKPHVNEPYLYHCKLLDVLLQTTVGEESFKLNTPKLKQFFKLGYLVELLLMRDNFLPGLFADNAQDLGKLKIKVVLFINWIYLNNELTQQEVIIKEQFNFIRLFQFEKDRLFKLELNPDREEYIRYFFDYLITIFTNFAAKMIPQNQEMNEREDYQILLKILKVILNYSESIFQGQLSMSQYNNLIKFIKQIDDSQMRVFSAQFVQCLKVSNEFKSSFRRSADPEQGSLIKSSQRQPAAITIFNKEEKRFLPEQFKQNQLKASPAIKGTSSQQIWSNKSNWINFLDACESTQTLQNQINEEIRTLASSIIIIDKLIPDNFRKSTSNQLDFKNFIKKYIKYVEQGVINKAEKANLIYSLKLMEELLNMGELEEQQNIFDQQNGTKMVLNIISDYKNYPFDDDLFNQLLSFGCKILEGGNKKVQKTIFNYFSIYTRSENIFCKLNMVINDHIEELKNKYKQQNEIKLVQKEQLLLETELGLPVDQVMDNSEETSEKQQVRESILIHVLRFVQLFCEGHNLDLQNYIRQQFNSRNNFNLVQSIIELLYMYHFEITNDNYNNILRCLDTLTEFIQGPCSQNQQTIIDSKFLEVAHSLLGLKVFKQQKDWKSRESDDLSNEKKSHTNLSATRSRNFKQFHKKNSAAIEKYMLERIKYKVMVLVTSLLELNSDSLAVKRIMRSLPVEILKKNLTSIYKRYKNLYGPNYTQEALKHIDQDPDDKQYSKEYHEVILETGFYIYFLISFYSELDTQEIDQETSSELQKAKSSMFNKNIFMDSLIGQLITFSIAIIGGVLITIKQIKEVLQKNFEKIGRKLDAAETEKLNQLKKAQNQEIFRETIQFFAQNSAHIEVVRNNQIERLQFFKPPHCKYLPKESKKEFHESVNRDSTNSKIVGLIEQTKNLIQVCKHEEQLALFFSKNKFIAIFANYVILWKDLAFILTILLNLFIILSYADKNATNDRQIRINNPQLINNSLTIQETEKLFFICGLIMIVCSTFVVIFFLLKKAPLYIREAWGKHDLSEYGLLINTLYQLFAICYCIIQVLLNIEVLYYLTYGTLAFIATFIHPFFFAFHLSEIVIRFPTLRNIIRSFWEPKIALLLTFILIILFNYFFTLFAYTFFYESYDNKCETLLYCFLETFDKAFKNNGGIGGWLDGNDPQDPARYEYGRFFYENLYNIIIVIIMIQIFSGIIIDTFSSLREKQMLRDRDIQETCFICGYSRELFDRKSEAGFKLHTLYEHYMWNYVFYISYLQDKESTEYTGIESYIAEKLQAQDNSWIPINKALGLKNMVLENTHYENEKLLCIQTEMDLIKKNVEQVIKTMEDLNQQFTQQ